MRQSGNDEKANEKFVRRMMQMALIRRMFGEDGYSNSAVSIGAASPLFSAGTFVRSELRESS